MANYILIGNEFTIVKLKTNQSLRIEHLMYHLKGWWTLSLEILYISGIFNWCSLILFLEINHHCLIYFLHTGNYYLTFLVNQTEIVSNLIIDMNINSTVLSLFSEQNDVSRSLYLCNTMQCSFESFLSFCFPLERRKHEEMFIYR